VTAGIGTAIATTGIDVTGIDVTGTVTMGPATSGASDIGMDVAGYTSWHPRLRITDGIGTPIAAAIVPKKSPDGDLYRSRALAAVSHRR